MSSDIQPGDVVIRVEYTGPDPLPPKHRKHRVDDGTPPPVGKHVRVLDTVLAGEIKEFGLVIAGYPSEHPTKAWHHLMFRKLNDGEDDAELIARIKSCRPVKQDA